VLIYTNLAVDAGKYIYIYVFILYTRERGKGGGCRRRISTEWSLVQAHLMSPLNCLKTLMTEKLYAAQLAEDIYMYT